MINYIRLRNFQGHRDTRLGLSSGVNVITGPSNIGKSSFIRALWWVARNRPLGAGEAFKHYNVDKKEEVSVTLDTDGGIVSRFRKGSKTGYRVNDDELVAVRTDVPKEVSDILDLGEHNIQTQHRVPGSNPYFLVEDGPADVARKLNEVCGLDIIDECLKNAAMLVSQNSQQTAEAERRVEELQTARDGYSDLKEREEVISRLEALEAESIALEPKIEDLGRLMDEAKAAQDKIKELNEFLGVEEKVDQLFVLLEERKEVVSKMWELDGLLKTVDGNRKDAARMGGEVAAMEKQFHNLFEERGVCPLCEQEIQHVSQ